jgi:hypothetical protein
MAHLRWQKIADGSDILAMARLRWHETFAERTALGGEFAGLDQFARRALAELMDAVVLVDPADYQCCPGESTGALHVLPFGAHSQGLVNFLVYPPDDLVLVVKIQWIGD